MERAVENLEKKGLSSYFRIVSMLNSPITEKMFLNGLKNSKVHIVATAIMNFQKSVFLKNLKVVVQLRALSNSKDELIRTLASSALSSVHNKDSTVLKQSSFPYNVSWADSIGLGGNAVGADFCVNLFAGTNLDCNHPTFNYEVSAISNVDVHLFDHHTTAIAAGFVYGRVNGSPAQDDIYLRVFGDTIYNRQLPQVYCYEGHQDIANSFPGYSVDYIVWVSVIPVVFSASVSLDLDLSYNWNVCPDALTASVELVPTGTLIVGGEAEIDLLIVKAGVKLEGSFEASIPPQIQLDGSLCEITFNVNYQSIPLTINFDAYFAVEECKYWIFDCHWKDESVVNIYSWKHAAYNTNLYSKTWKIGK